MEDLLFNSQCAAATFYHMLTMFLLEKWSIHAQDHSQQVSLFHLQLRLKNNFLLTMKNILVQSMTPLKYDKDPKDLHRGCSCQNKLIYIWNRIELRQTALKEHTETPLFGAHRQKDAEKGWLTSFTPYSLSFQNPSLHPTTENNQFSLQTALPLKPNLPPTSRFSFWWLLSFLPLSTSQHYLLTWSQPKKYL